MTVKIWLLKVGRGRGTRTANRNNQLTGHPSKLKTALDTKEKRKNDSASKNEEPGGRDFIIVSTISKLRKRLGHKMHKQTQDKNCYEVAKRSAL